MTDIIERLKHVGFQFEKEAGPYTQVATPADLLAPSPKFQSHGQGRGSFRATLPSFNTGPSTPKTATPLLGSVSKALTGKVGKTLAFGGGAALTGLAAYKALKHYQRKKQQEQSYEY